MMPSASTRRLRNAFCQLVWQQPTVHASTKQSDSLGDSFLLNRALTGTMPAADDAAGIYVTAADGHRYIDFGSGIAVTNIGQGVQEVIDKIKVQLSKATFIYNGHFSNTAAEKCAELLLGMCVAGGELRSGRVVFCNSGSEANEIALKLARQYHNERGYSTKYKVISRYRSYHGNTLAAAALSDRPSWTDQFEVYLNRDAFPSRKMAAPNAYRGYGLDASELERIILEEGPDTVSAFIAEPVCGTSLAGAAPPLPYFKEIRRICDKYDVLLICDEVITGLGRTGKPFAIQHWGVEPDILTTAKGLCAGYGVLAGVIVAGPVCRTIAAGSGSHTQGHTHTANPLSCATASAVLEYLVEHRVVESAASMGEEFGDLLRDRLSHSPIVGDIRGVGMFWGVELVQDKSTKQPFDAGVGVTARVVKSALGRGLMLIGGSPGCADGTNGDQLQLSPPLVCTRAQLEEAVEIMAAAIEEVRGAVSLATAAASAEVISR